MMMLYVDYVWSEDLNDLYLAFSTLNSCLGRGSQKMGTYRVMLTLAIPSLTFGHFYSSRRILISLFAIAVETLSHPSSLNHITPTTHIIIIHLNK